MQVFNDYNSEAAEIIKSGGVGVIRTDTLYGIVARADDTVAVERVFQIKQRTPSKPPIVLIASTDQLFDKYPNQVYAYLNANWPGPVSIILPSKANLDWLARGSSSISYRLPAKADLVDFINQTGPLIAPSANPEGLLPASTIDQAMTYFGESVDFYIDSSTVDIDQPPSQLWRYDIETGESKRLR